MQFTSIPRLSPALITSLVFLLNSSLYAADTDTDGIDDSIDICVLFYDPLQEGCDDYGFGDP